jgi:hypothetical protein
MTTEFEDEPDGRANAFRFAPELFELRNEVLAALEDKGFHWFSHFSSVDLLHDVYGVEVRGIKEREDATGIQRLLGRMFAAWRLGGLYFYDFGRDPGWRVKVQRDRDPPDEHWDTGE